MFSWRSLPHRPIVVAHRGASAIAPENTLAAFQLALNAGADAIELDIHLSSDNHVVVIHDSRLSRTSSGKGAVKNTSLKELKRLSAGSWFHKKFTSEKIPTLSEVFELVRGRIGINVEIKTERGRTQSGKIVERLIDVIHKFHATQCVLISSFHHPYVEMAKQLDSTIATGTLYHPVHHLRKRFSTLATATNADFFICDKHLLRAKAVKHLHDRQISIGVYVINSERSLNKFVKMGVDCVYTDDPEKILRALNR